MWDRLERGLSVACVVAVVGCGVNREGLFSSNATSEVRPLESESGGQADVPPATSSDAAHDAGREPAAPLEDPPSVDAGVENLAPDLMLGETPPVEDTPVETDPPDAGPLEPAGVVSVTPPDLAVGVAADAVVVVTFRTSMDRESTEAAYASEALPGDGVAFSWNDDSTELSITPNDPLPLASGTDPQEVEALSYAFTIATSAQDERGRPLPEAFTSSFSTLRRIVASLSSVQDRSLTGNHRSNDTEGAGPCSGNDSTNVCVGDGATAANAQYKGFITFDLGPVSTPVAAVETATLSLTVTNVLGDPFDGLGALLAEHVAFDSVGLEAFAATELDSLGVLAEEGDEDSTFSLDVQGAVAADLAARDRAQFRFLFEQETDDDNAVDILLSAWDTHRLDITYLLP